MSKDSGSGSGSQTVTSTQQIPQWEQGFIQSNQTLAQALGSTPYPTYNGQMIADLSPLQNTAINSVAGAGSSYAPDLNAAQNVVAGEDPSGVLTPSQNVPSFNPTSVGAFAGPGYTNTDPNTTAQQAGLSSSGLTPTNTASSLGVQSWPTANTASYMNPYVMSALAPQLQQLQTTQAQQNNAINASATQAGAFGDARNANNVSYNNFLNNLQQQGVVSNALSNAYTTGMSQFNNDQQNTLAAGNLGQTAYNQGQANQLSAYQTGVQGLLGQESQGVGQFQASEQASAAQQAQQLAQQQALLQAQQGQASSLGTLAQSSQSLGLNDINAMYGAGTAQQTQQQNELTNSYQQYLNQMNWPYQMLNVLNSAASLNPYTLTNATTTPTSATAGGVGSLAALLGGAGSLAGGSTPSAPAGGQAISI